MRIAPFVASMLLASLPTENQLTVFADPGQYEFFNCEQLAKYRSVVKTREQELKQLMDRAEKSARGTFVNVIYKGEYMSVMEELKVIDGTARVKKCRTPENWRNFAIR